MTTNPRTSTFTFPISQRELIDPYLPPSPSPSTVSSTSTSTSSTSSSVSPSSLPSPSASSLPFLTLTYATTLDSTLSLLPGHYHSISSPASLAMTHYLRSRYSAILIGVGTAVADNPSLNCRLDDHPAGAENQPRPVIIDPKGRLRLSSASGGHNPESQFLKLARENRGKGPWIITSLPPSQIPEEDVKVLESYGGRYITLPSLGLSSSSSSSSLTKLSTSANQIPWHLIMTTLFDLNLSSILIDGGGFVINDWLSNPEHQSMLDSVIVTVAPTWLGSGGVVVKPERRYDENGQAMVCARCTDVRWVPMGEDIVLCGKFKDMRG